MSKKTFSLPFYSDTITTGFIS